MLMCAILNWGSDLMIMPAVSKEWLKGKKQRMNLNADYVLFSSQFFCPVKLDEYVQPISEEEQIELMGNPSRRHAIWDKEDAKAKPKPEFSPVFPRARTVAPVETVTTHKCKSCGNGITKKQAERTYHTYEKAMCETCEVA